MGVGWTNTVPFVCTRLRPVRESYASSLQHARMQPELCLLVMMPPVASVSVLFVLLETAAQGFRFIPCISACTYACMLPSQRGVSRCS